MTSQQILQSDFLDILFEGRNKAYGAYALRKQYNRQMMKALAIALCLLFLILFFPRFFSASQNAAVIVDDYAITTTVINPVNPKVELPKITPQKIPQLKSADFQNLKLVNKDVPPLATQEALLTSVISTKNSDGLNAVPSISQPPAVVLSGTGIETSNPEPTKEVKPDKQPQFPGGMQAWAAFLNHNLHSPQDLENGERRIVNIRFHVDVDGVITNFQIIQSGGAAFDDEVIRVLKKMPKWMPALQAGKPVAVSFTQPVTFVGAEE